jgi:glycosyltransferase involved in cell wall biosynthesis
MALILPLLRRVERYTMRRATRINLVSEGFRDYFRKICPNGNFSFHPNGIDEEFIGHDFSRVGTNDRPVILYAGNIGAGQGLECILPQAAVRLGEACRIEVIGDGGMRRQLESEIQRLGLKNILLLDPMPRARLLDHYGKADYLLLHLNDYRAFHKVLPSKLFEYGATGKPVLAGVAGFAREFINRELDHAEVFDPCDAEGMIRALGKLRPGHYYRTEFIAKFRRTAIMDRMAGDILECAV